jgi:hypothetical protein
VFPSWVFQKEEEENCFSPSKKNCIVFFRYGEPDVSRPGDLMVSCPLVKLIAAHP